MGSFISGVPSWAISAPGDYTRLKIVVDYGKNVNSAWFTNVFVHREKYGKSYGYDENKNLVSVTNLANLKKNAEYDKYDNLLSYRRYGAGETEKYTYSYGDTDEEKKKQDKETDAKDEGSAEEKDANAADSGENETKQEEESAGEQTA